MVGHCQILFASLHEHKNHQKQLKYNPNDAVSGLTLPYFQQILSCIFCMFKIVGIILLPYYKSSPKRGLTFGLFWKRSKNCCGYFLGNLWKYFCNFFTSTSGHTGEHLVTLLAHRLPLLDLMWKYMPLMTDWSIKVHLNRSYNKMHKWIVLFEWLSNFINYK